MITVPVGLLRAGLPALDPAAAGATSASPSAGWATARACWARSTCAFRDASGPTIRNGSDGCPTRPEKRGTFNTWVSHEQETGRPILLSFSNGATAARLDRSAGDAEVKDVAMTSLRKMFGDDIPEPEAMLYPRWLSDPWSRGGYSYPGVGSAAGGSTPITPGRWRGGFLRRRGDGAGRIRHGACGPLVGRADRRGDLPGGHRHRPDEDARPWYGARAGAGRHNM